MVVSKAFEAKAVACEEDKKAGNARLEAFLIPRPPKATGSVVWLDPRLCHSVYFFIVFEFSHFSQFSVTQCMSCTVCT